MKLLRLLFVELLIVMTIGCIKNNGDTGGNRYYEFFSFIRQLEEDCVPYKLELKDIHTGENKIKPVLEVEELKKYFPEPRRVEEHKERISIYGNKEYLTVRVRVYIYDGFSYRIINFKDLKNYAFLSFLDLRKAKVPIYYKGVEISNMRLEEYLKRLSIEMTVKKDTFCIYVWSYDYLYNFREAYSYNIRVKIHFNNQYWMHVNLIFENQYPAIIELFYIELYNE